MTSLRHNPVSSAASRRVESSGDPREAHLDAARACILEVGWRRTTLTDVAKRAGVSRMTIYRAWADMPTLLADLMTREWSQVAAATAASGRPDVATPEGLADALVAGVRALRANELFGRILELDAELLLPYLLTRRGRTQEALVGIVAQQIRVGQQAGAIRPGSSVAMARSLVLAAHGLAISADTMTDDDLSRDDLDEEFRRLVSGGLRP